jgi:dihydroorotate dehydrogenase subfamily 1
LDLTIDFCGVSLKNPLIVGSCDLARSAGHFLALVESGAGAVVMKSLSDISPLQKAAIAKFLCLNPALQPWKPGQPVGGFYSRGGGMLSEEEWARGAGDALSLAKSHGVLMIGSICASTLENWKRMARRMQEEGVGMIELNLGNPHYTAAPGLVGARISQEEDFLGEVIQTVAEAVTIPVIAKLSPQMSHIVRLAQLAGRSGASAVTISHRFQGLLIDIDKREPLGSIPFGYGGPWMLPIAIGYVAKVSKEVGIPICGSGGIFGGRDVLQFMMAGASTVQVTTALMTLGTGLIHSMLKDMEDFCRAKDIGRIGDLVGCAIGKTGYYDRLPETARMEVQNSHICRACPQKPCVEACCFEAIRRKGDGTVEISDACTACGFCFQVCPFPGALAMKE